MNEYQIPIAQNFTFRDVRQSSQKFIMLDSEGREIGKFAFVDGHWTFTGDCDECARAFAEHVAQRLDVRSQS